MVTYENVLNAPIDKLATAVRDWQAMAAKLEELAGAARNGMKAKADKAEWSGVTAGVARPFVAKTAEEFEDAAKEAKGIHRALAQGHDTFRSSRDRLRKIAEEAPAAGFRVDGKGKVEALPLVTEQERDAARHDPDYRESLRVNLPRWQAKVDAEVDACDDVDRSLARLLDANVADDHDFTAPKYAGLTAEQAGRATDLARKGRDLSHAELAELNELLGDNAAKAEFSTAFYGNLGPKGALRFFGAMATDTHPYGDLDEQRLADVRELQKNLGLNLATATRSTAEPHLPDSYAQELRRLGTQQIPLGRYEQNPPFGYQLLGGIMRHGNYDPRFLVPIAEHATQIHAKDPDFFNRGRQLGGGYGRNVLNPSGTNGAGYDPVVSFLEALGHSPAAAAEFFDPKAPHHAYDLAGTVRPGAPDLGRDAAGKPITTYLDFFADEKYRATIDTEGVNPDDLAKTRNHTPDALGHALEAAALGHAWDDPRPQLHRTEGGARVMEAVALKYGGDAELLKHHEVLADSLGHMTAGYVDDVNRALDDEGEQSVFAPRAGDGQAHAEFGRDGARDLLAALGQHPDAYATVSTAERVHSASVLEHQVAQGAVDEGRARAVVRTGAEAQGILDESRAAQVRELGEKQHKAYEKAHERSSHWVEFGTTAVIAVGVAFLPATAAAAGAAAVVVPLAVDTGSGAVEQAASGVIGEWSDETKQKHEDEVAGKTHASNKAMFQAGEHSAEAPMRQFVRRHGIDPNGDFGNDLVEAVRVGYGSGNSIARQQGHEAQTKPGE